MFGVVSYGTASLGFLVLFAILATSWQGRAAGRSLILAVAMTAVWAAVLAWHAWQPDLPLILVSTCEILRDGMWIAALTGLSCGIVPRSIALAGRTLWIGLLVATWLLALLDAISPAAPGPEPLFIPGGMVMALVMLVFIEQMFRHAGAADREGLKYLVVGLGGAFAYDLFLYSHAMLFDGVAAEPWNARGLVTALLVPFIAIAARRNPHWSLDVFVSRQAVMFTTAVVAVSLYLLVMGLGGYYLRELSGRWGPTAHILFIAGALSLLATLVMSGQARRRLRVFVSKHFFRNKYDYRVEWLRFVETLSAAGETDVRRTSLRAIAQIFDSPGAVMYLRESPSGPLVPAAAWPMSLADLPDLEPLPSGGELTRFIGERQWVIDLAEHAASPEAYRHLAIPEWLRTAAGVRMIVPLFQARELLGLVLLYSPPDPFVPTYEDRDLQKTLGRHVATLVAQQETDRRLADSRQFEAYHRLTAFMMHDLKNAIAQLQLILGNAGKHKSNPEFVDDMIVTVDNAVKRMNGLIEQLQGSPRAANTHETELAAVLANAMARCQHRRPLPQAGFPPGLSLRVCADQERLAAALEHVIRNAQDASPPEGRIELELVADDRQARIVVTDSGPGMTAEFLRERLFQPFDSTKGAKGMGIGAYQVREYVQSIGGAVQVQSAPGHGTRFEIRLPLATSGGGDT
jgi:putative PEP-CTERM system histidine kinase